MSIDQKKFISEVKKRKAYRAETHSIIERASKDVYAESATADALTALARIAFLKTYPGNEKFPEPVKDDGND